MLSDRVGLRLPEQVMQSPAEFSRDHQPTYIPATNRVLAGFLTAGVYALVLVVASHRTPTPNRAAPSEIAARMEAQQQARREAFQARPAQEQSPQASPQNASQETPPQMRRNASQTSSRQQSASPSLLERLFGRRDQTAAPVPGMAPAPGPGEQAASGAKPSSGAQGEQSASAQSAPAEQLASSSSP